MTTRTGQNAKHTPGPWEYFEQKEWGRDRMYGCVRGPAWSGGMASGMVIINGCAPGGTEEQKANARLIAASPIMLKAFYDIIDEVWDGENLRLRDAVSLSVIREKCRAMIAIADA